MSAKNMRRLPFETPAGIAAFRKNGGMSQWDFWGPLGVTQSGVDQRRQKRPRCGHGHPFEKIRMKHCAAVGSGNGAHQQFTDHARIIAAVLARPARSSVEESDNTRLHRRETVHPYSFTMLATQPKPRFAPIGSGSGSGEIAPPAGAALLIAH
ncbi:MAG: hypothetical protein H6948_05390 [Zoogloeaceae bacterium]|nr:hypothetical protein [Zoogloeaceae bacterium]